ncbi:unnamed protein product [Rotaria magnacalcarata]|uniref:BIG2 domain-containing protein n=1 Tax=Rotaria magnacalcarata TaxID=392030 RepID=A0A817AC39_9BILA|nr:unnamed protein product [Rotaria magnacalcarata]CAF4245378.1 unnamed protein product [Rotaria magnacalcarata]
MGNALYDVKGLVAGDTTVKISSQSAMSDGPLYSNSRPLQVFPPLRVFPRNVTLIVGAIFQVETKGGPYPNSAVEFYIKNETVASTSYTGIVTAMSLGTTLLNAKSVSVGKDQQPLIISQMANIQYIGLGLCMKTILNLKFENDK